MFPTALAHGNRGSSPQTQQVVEAVEAVEVKEDDPKDRRLIQKWLCYLNQMVIQNGHRNRWVFPLNFTLQIKCGHTMEILHNNSSGWWFGTFFIPYIGNFIIPTSHFWRRFLATKSSPGSADGVEGSWSCRGFGWFDLLRWTVEAWGFDGDMITIKLCIYIYIYIYICLTFSDF